MALQKIVSGGQTGADRAALDWARGKGIPHGGWCPKGRQAEDGTIPACYDLRETPSGDYAQRTEWNVRDSDGTVVISIGVALVGGSKATIQFAGQLQKPVVHISRDNTPQPGQALVEFVRAHNIFFLNVAGPRASEEPRVATFTAEVLDGLLTEMDNSQISARLFDHHAETYREKFMDQSMYAAAIEKFCELLPPGKPRVLDAACGPGNVARLLKGLRPDLEVVGIDLAPRMVELAREAVPDARFAVGDLRKVSEWGAEFSGIICAFGLPYISKAEAVGFIAAASQALISGGVLYVSTMLGRSEDSGWHRSTTGDEVHITYYSETEVSEMLEAAGFEIVWETKMQSPSAASKKTTDLVVIARR